MKMVLRISGIFLVSRQTNALPEGSLLASRSAWLVLARLRKMQGNSQTLEAVMNWISSQKRGAHSRKKSATNRKESIFIFWAPATRNVTLITNMTLFIYMKQLKCEIMYFFLVNGRCLRQLAWTGRLGQADFRHLPEFWMLTAFGEKKYNIANFYCFLHLPEAP